MSRPITAAERRLFQHVTMFGSVGYPVRKLGRSWVWGTDEVKGPPTVFKTKRAACLSFEAWLDVIREALGEEAQARAIAGLRERGFTEEQIEAEIAAAMERAS